MTVGKLRRNLRDVLALIAGAVDPYRGENPAPGKDVHGELDPTPGIREQPRPIPDISGLFLLRCTGLTCYTEPADPWPWGTPHEATRFHQTDWRCGGGMATRRARG